MSNISNTLSLKRSSKDPKYFYEWLGYTWGDHIGDWMDMYGKRGNVNVHRVCIIAPRDHSKSTTLRVAVLWSSLFEKWRDKPFTTWLFSASKDLASRRLAEIRDDMARHPQLRNLIDPKRGGKFEIFFTNGAWIRATGVGAAIRGEHPARIVFDDVLDDIGDQSPSNLRHWFRKKITPMLSPGTSMFVVGTPMAMTDLYHTEMLSNSAWTTTITSAIPNWEEHKADPTIEPIALWESQRPISFLLEQKEAIGELAFTQEYLCKVVDDDSQAFRREHTRANMNTSQLGVVFSQSAGRNLIVGDSAEPRLLSELKRYCNIVPTIKGQGSVNYGIALLQDYTLIIDPTSTNIIKELNNYQWSDTKSETPLQNGFDHQLDALRYAVSYQLANPNKGKYYIG